MCLTGDACFKAQAVEHLGSVSSVSFPLRGRQSFEDAAEMCKCCPEWSSPVMHILEHKCAVFQSSHSESVDLGSKVDK